MNQDRESFISHYVIFQNLTKIYVEAVGVT